MKMLSVFFTDREVIMVEKRKGFTPLSDYVSAKMPEGYIVNGKIEMFDELVEFLEGIISRTKITAKKTNLLLHEKIVTFKLYDLPEDIKERKIRKYLESKMDAESGLPFSDPIIDYHVSYIKGIKEAIVFGASNSLVEKYKELLEAVGLTLFSTDIPALSSHRLLSSVEEEDSKVDHVMFAHVYDNIVSLTFFNRQYPQFNFISDLEEKLEDLDPDDFIQIVQDEIYRMSNYYVWNLNKGTFRIDQAVIIPMTSKEEMNTHLIESVKSNNLSGVENVVFLESILNESLYDVDLKYLLAISNTL